MIKEQSLTTTLNIWKTSRKIFLEYFENYTLDQLNTTPNGFSNNLIWNIGHVIVAQQGLIYRSSDLECYVPDRLFDLYKPGTKPTGNTSQEEVDELKDLLIFMIEKTESDLITGKFKTYNERMTGTGFFLASLEDALQFNNYHEALHLGFMMNLRKFV